MDLSSCVSEFFQKFQYNYSSCMYLWYCTIPEQFSHKITFLWDTHYTNPTHKCSLNLSHWNFFNFEIFFIFSIFAKSIFSRNLKMKNFNGTGGYMATGVPLKFFTCPTEIFGFLWIQYKIRLRKRTKYPEYASRIFGEATSLFSEKFRKYEFFGHFPISSNLICSKSFWCWKSVD